ncbi:hypothetical protein CEQ90_05380 [Lewinellaceae bacterium SD302]|nr:hypothetical protein CEQ90_05380 [Lewinellaceae bacterium SD302]
MQRRFYLLPLLSFIFFGLNAQVVELDLLRPVERFQLAAAGQSVQEYTIGPLRIGHEYQVILASEHNSPVSVIELLNGAATRRQGNFYWQGIALGPQMRFAFNNTTTSRLSVINLTTGEQESTPVNSFLQQVPIVTEDNDDAELLVGSIFRNNSCFETSNHEYTGFYGLFGSLTDTISQLGTFTSGMTSVGIDQGIVMTTGRVSRAAGPNAFTGTTQVYFTDSNDPDIIQLTGGDTDIFDPVIVEFDFTPTTDEINFNYVFASEEYCEAVTNNTVDVFGFFISGPGINGPYSNNAENIATLPDGITPINVTTINDGVNSQFYRSNVPDSFNEPCQVGPPVAENDIEYDGMSTVMTASASVIPCETYHLKLVLVDMGDYSYDSAIFLEAGSFAAGLVNVSEPGVTAEDGGLANAPLEGCSDGTLIFSRLDSSDINTPLTVYFNISPTGTATFGVDYTMPTDSFVIDAGDFSDTLLIDIFGDQIAEGTESIILRLDGTCNCAANTTEFFIVDPDPTTLTVADPLSACPGSFTDLSPIVTGGVGDYEFEWSTGSTDSVLNVEYFAGDSMYIVSVTDNCAQLMVDTVIVSAPDIRAEVSGAYSLCDDPTATIPIILSGGATDYTITIDEGGTTQTYSNTSGVDTIFLDFADPTTVTLLTVVGDGCNGLVAGSATVTGSEFDVSAQLTDLLCNGDSTGAILLDVNGTPASYTYTWNIPGLSGSNPTDLEAGTYLVTITDAAGCFTDTSFVLTEPAQPIAIALDSIRDQSCDETAYLAVSASGGAGGFTYEWLNSGTMGPVLDGIDGAQTYEVAVQDLNGCTDTLSFTPLDTRPVVTAEIDGFYTLCDNPVATIPVVVEGATTYTITITENGVSQTYTGGPDTIFLTYTSGTDIVLTSVEAEGCGGSVTGMATVYEADFGLVPLVDTIDCFGADDGRIFFSLNGNINDYSITWDNVLLSGNEANGLAAGNYTVTITDPAGCTLDTTFSITQPAAALSLGLQSSSGQTCLDDGMAIVSANGGTGSYQIDWGDGGANTFTRTDLNGGQTYFVTVTDANGCTETLNVAIPDERTTIDASIGSATDQLTCTDPAIMLGSAVNSGVVEYVWTDVNGTVIGNTDSLNVTQPGNYTLQVTDPANGCTDTQNITISQSGDFLELADEGPYAITCAEMAVDLTVNAVDFNGAVNYEWFDASGTSVGTGTTLPAIAISGNYEVRAERQDNGCVSFITVVLGEDLEEPSVDIAFEPLSCIVDTATLLVQNPATNYTFLWSSAENILGDPTASTVQYDSPGSYALMVTDQDNGCTMGYQLLLNRDDRTLVAEAGNDERLPCGDIQLTLNGNASPSLNGTTFRWLDSDGNVLSEAANYSPESRGDYILEVTHPESGCVSTDMVNIFQEGPESVDLTLRQPPCVEVGGTIEITGIEGGDAPYSFLLDGVPVDPTTPNLVTGLAEGSYVLTVLDDNGCSIEVDALIFAPQEFTGTTEAQTIRIGEDAQLGFRSDRSGNLSFIGWTAPVELSCLNCPDPLATLPLESFTASILLIDANGCELTLRQEVFVDRSQMVYAPTAISPYNPDGLNDKFILYGDERFVTSIDYLRVFDRWGGAIWEGTELMVNDESEGWDGTDGGQDINGGAYVFSAQVTYFDGRKEIIKGTINILR